MHLYLWLEGGYPGKLELAQPLILLAAFDCLMPWCLCVKHLSIMVPHEHTGTIFIGCGGSCWKRVGSYANEHMTSRWVLDVSSNKSCNIRVWQVGETPESISHPGNLWWIWRNHPQIILSWNMVSYVQIPSVAKDVDPMLIAALAWKLGGSHCRGKGH